MRKGLVAFCSFLMMFAFALVAHGQTITGSVNGTVTDPSGAAILGAKVTATNIETNVSSIAETNSDGVYSMRFLQIGHYKITITANGFSDRSFEPFALEAGQTAKVDGKMAIAGSSTQVQVTENLAPLLNTESGELGLTLDSSAIDNIPLAGRNFSGLTIFTPGAVVTNPTSFTGSNALERNISGGAQVSVNGNRQQSNNFLLDGIEINETINNTIGYNPSPDALGQIRTISANAQAEYGNVNGGDVIALLKSGANKLHGSAFYYVDNYNLNANSWANNLNHIAKQSSTSNIFGVTIGGPILHDRLFFFADYSGNRYHQGGTAAASVATANMRTGDFSELLDAGIMGGSNKTIQLYDPLTTGSPAYGNNRLPSTAISPVAQYLFAHPELYPVPNQAPTAGTPMTSNYKGVSKNRIYNDQFDAKVDYTLNAKNTMFVRYSQSTAGDTNTNPIAITFPTASTYPTKGVAYQLVHTFSPNIVNEFRLGFFRTAWHQGNPSDTTGVFKSNGNTTVGIGGGTITEGFTAQTFAGNGPIPVTSGGQTVTPNIGTQALYSDNVMNNYTYADNLTIQRGKHVFKMGGQFIRYQQNSIYTGNDGAQGQLQYNGNFTANTGTAINSSLATGFNFADFYLDRVFYAGRGTLAGHTGQRQWRDAGFIQDDWKAMPNLTINLGLRWEWDQPIYEVNNKEANLNLQTGAVLLAGVNGNSRALYNNVWTNFMPRIGFSFSPTPRLVIRGGYGTTTYLEGTGANLRLTINPPFQTSLSYTASAPSTGNPGSSVTAETAFSTNGAACPYATKPTCGQIFRAWDKNLRPSTVQEESLTLEYQVSNTASFQIGYVGEYAYHLIQARWDNQLFAPCFSSTGALLTYNSAACFAVNKAPYYQLVGQSGSVRTTASGAMMNYNALQTTFRQRLHNGLLFTANYAYSKSLTNSIGFFGVSNVSNNSAYAENPRNNSLEYGPAGTDARHNLNFNMVYDLPFGRGRMFGGKMNRLMDEVAGGWKVAVTGFVYTGFPTTITSSTNNAGVGSNQQRMLHLRPLKLTGRSVQHWFGTDASAAPCNVSSTGAATDNGTCAYAMPPNGVISPARPATERLPGFQQYDASAFKDFSITETQRISFRVDASNVFNIASYGNPDRSAQSSTFGQITSTRSGPRLVQLSAKYQF